MQRACARRPSGTRLRGRGFQGPQVPFPTPPGEEQAWGVPRRPDMQRETDTRPSTNSLLLRSMGTSERTPPVPTGRGSVLTQGAAPLGTHIIFCRLQRAQVVYNHSSERKRTSETGRGGIIKQKSVGLHSRDDTGFLSKWKAGGTPERA